MKPSHFSTPRSLSDCQWQTGYTSRDDDLDAARGIVTGALLSLCLVAGCALVVHLIVGWVGS